MSPWAKSGDHACGLFFWTLIFAVFGILCPQTWAEKGDPGVYNQPGSLSLLVLVLRTPEGERRFLDS